MTTLRAPERLATSAPMMPIGPAPVTSTSSPTRSNERAVCTALPNGSKIAAISSGTSSGIGTTLYSGRQTNSPNEPGRLTPTPSVLRHRCPRPARQLRHLPQTICPSPETRSPTWYLVTAEPTSAISPMNSWPTTIGTGMVFCAHWSQFQMCTSVPQIADFFTLIKTSFGPTSGTGTRSIHKPISGFDFTSAFIMFVIDLFLRSHRGRGRPLQRRQSPGARRSRCGRPTSACGCAPVPWAPPGRRSR